MENQICLHFNSLLSGKWKIFQLNHSGTLKIQNWIWISPMSSSYNHHIRDQIASKLLIERALSPSIEYIHLILEIIHNHLCEGSTSSCKICPLQLQYVYKQRYPDNWRQRCVNIYCSWHWICVQILGYSDKNNRLSEYSIERANNHQIHTIHIRYFPDENVRFSSHCWFWHLAWALLAGRSTATHMKSLQNRSRINPSA